MGRASHAPRTPTRNDYLGFVDRLGDHVPIIHWHAHENRGDCDSHLASRLRDDPGLRELVRRLKQRGFLGSVVLEQWPQPAEPGAAQDLTGAACGSSDGGLYLGGGAGAREPTRALRQRNPVHTTRP